MICQICNVNQATIHIQEIVNGSKNVLHICPQCAEKKAMDDPMLQGFNLPEMLYNLTHNIDPAAAMEQQPGANPPPEPLLTCAYCNWTSEQLKKNGRLGCPKCYTAFSDLLNGMFLNMHRGTVHSGKTPEKQESDPELSRKFKNHNAMKQELLQLQKNLEECVKREEYELAAELRDKINSLKKELASSIGESES